MSSAASDTGHDISRHTARRRLGQYGIRSLLREYNIIISISVTCVYYLTKKFNV